MWARTYQRRLYAPHTFLAHARIRTPAYIRCIFHVEIFYIVSHTLTVEFNHVILEIPHPIRRSGRQGGILLFHL